MAAPAQLEDTPRVDLNQATTEQLAELSGIGSKLAHRIAAYREEVGPFLDPKEILEVPGIGPILYERLSDRLMVTPPASGFERMAAFSPPMVEEASNGGEQMPSPPDIEEPPAVDAGSTTLPPRVGSITPSPLEESETDTEQIQPKAPKAELSAAEPAPTAAAPSTTRRFGWLWSALLGAVLGGLLGMILSLLVFAGINGAIDVGRTQAVDQLRGQLSGVGVEVDAIRSDVSTLQGDVSGIRQRLEVLAGLTARMEQAEDTLEVFTQEIRSLQQQTGALQTTVDTLGQDLDGLEQTVDAVEAQTERAMSFFEQLRGLLNDLFGEAEPESETPAPVRLEVQG